MTLKEQIRANRWRTLWLLLLFAALAGLLGAIGAFLYDPSILVVVAVVAFSYAIFSWFAAGRMVAGLTGAKPVERSQYPRLFHVLETVCIAAGIDEVPPVYVIDDPAPNAFAAGRGPKHAYVAVTTGLLQLMDERELEGVLAHEMSHVRNRDVRLMTLVAVLVGLIALVSDVLLRVSFWGGGRRQSGWLGIVAMILGLAALLLAPVAGFLIQLAVSRRREYLADASAAEITGDGEGLALALRKLQLDTQQTRHAPRAVAHMFIESPLNQTSGLGSLFKGAFETHPPLEARIAALEESGGFKLPPP
jgi:heat shock protein HtpX